jgi:hypothetical protein
MNARWPKTLSAVPRTIETRMEILKAVRALAGRNEMQKASPNDPEHPGGRRARQTAKEENSSLKTVVATLQLPPARECLKLNVRPSTKKIWPFAGACVWMHVTARQWHAIQRVPRVTRYRRSIFRDEPWSLRTAC